MDQSLSRSALLAAANMDWSVIAELAAEPELARRRILRPHAETDATTAAGDSGSGRDTSLRARLDQALDRLMLLELGIETRRFTLEQSGAKDLPGLSELLKSEAFIRFLNAHLYFGVRFFARRLVPEAGGADRVAAPDDASPAGSGETNALPAWLFFPPGIEGDTAPAVLGYLAAYGSDGDVEMQMALGFLDDYVSRAGEPLIFELWLRGLWLAGTPDGENRFRQIARGMVSWIRNRVVFYCRLEGIDASNPLLHVEWLARNPLSARFAVLDLYWLSRLLRADVTAVGTVTCEHHSWLNTLALRAASDPTLASPDELRRAEKIIRAVFGYACDLIQNSVELSDAEYRRLHDPENVPQPPATTVNWRSAFDDELAEIDSQRAIRTFGGGLITEPGAAAVREGGGDERGWSRRVRTGQHPGHLTGLAFSGGGIRSATFNLGVLQGLQELDLLRQVDFLSTVSGGGYIGAWLTGNVRRTPYWLGRLTDWSQSIAHLRRYSNYLAPNTGFLSPDSWTIGTVWLRNTLLIQITAIVWLALTFTIMRATKVLFDYAGHGAKALDAALVLVAIGLLGLGALYNLLPARPLAPGTRQTAQEASRFRPWGQMGVVCGVAAPAWIGAFCATAWMWSEASQLKSARVFSDIVQPSFHGWWPALAALFAAFAVLAWFTLPDRNAVIRRLSGSLAAAALCVGAVFLAQCGIEWGFERWSQNPGHDGWYAFVFGPPLVMIAAALSVVLFNGLCGRDAQGWANEWWSRTGAWLGMVGLVFLAIGIADVLGPRGVLALFRMHPGLSSGALAAWAGTIVSGLYAGNSSSTDGGAGSGTSALLELLPKAAGFLFVAGVVAAVAFGLHEVLNAFGVGYWEAYRSRVLVVLGTAAAILTLFGLIFCWRFDLNMFGLSEFYRNRLVRCYLGATRWRPGWRKPHPFTGFDDNDDICLSELRTRGLPAETAFRGPFPVVNCTLNLGGSSDLSLHTRRGAPFTITPLHCGADRARVGYAPMTGFAGGLTLGRAIAVSGAAASPNSGYSTSILASLLLTMFNVRLGWWFPNPGGSAWDSGGIGKSLLFRELFGLADENGKYLNVSDGGHFENLGIYEMVRRQCRLIIASDAECDPDLQFGSLGNVVRICETDFGAKIDLDVESVRKVPASGLSQAHCAVGTITYSNGDRGCIIYLKAAMTGDEDIGIAQYRAVHPAFPHESTEDQFYAEDQFESYRRLGHHIVLHAFRGVGPGETPAEIGDRLADVWAPAGPGAASYESFARDLDELRERFRSAPDLARLFKELAEPGEAPETGELTQAEVCACLEMTQFMERVFLGIRLGDYWEHPDNRGWALLFSSWARSPLFRAVWSRNIQKFGISFEYFCSERIGLPSVRPVARV